MRHYGAVWFRARFAVMTAALVVVMVLAAAWGWRYGLEQTQGQLTQAQSDLTAHQTQLTAKASDAAYLQSAMPAFERLRQSGAWGQADRVAWVEQLVVSHERLNLPPTLSYTLQPPQSTPASGDAPSAVVQFHDLDFSLRNIHEGELLDLLADYASHVPGRWRVNACTLSEVTPAGLTARCQLRFFSVLATPSRK